MEFSLDQRVALEQRFDVVEERLEELATQVKQIQREVLRLGANVSQLIESVREMRLLLANLGNLMHLPPRDPEVHDRETLPDITEPR